MTLATLFLAQATNTPLTLGQEMAILGIAMLTSVPIREADRLFFWLQGPRPVDHPGLTQFGL